MVEYTNEFKHASIIKDDKKDKVLKARIRHLIITVEALTLSGSLSLLGQ